MARTTGTGLRVRVWAALAAGLLAGGAVTAGEVEPTTDHLQCWEANDDAQAAKLLRSARVSLSGSAFEETACRVVGLRSFCAPVAKQLVEPAEPINDFEGDAATGSYACYKVECDGPSAGAHAIVDQFGDRTITLRKTRELCAPVQAGSSLALAATWTDTEKGSNEMPAAPWGDCASEGKDRIRIEIAFDGGVTASATYSGVAPHWNTGDFTGLEPDEADGFLADCDGLHYLYADGSSLPMAWESCSMEFAGNFDLDYSESNGSHFRADSKGWVSASFTTYCGD
jgi:hypothetical protein